MSGAIVASAGAEGRAVESAPEAVDAILEMRKGNTLGDITIRELIEAGVPLLPATNP